MKNGRVSNTLFFIKQKYSKIDYFSNSFDNYNWSISTAIQCKLWYSAWICSIINGKYSNLNWISLFKLKYLVIKIDSQYWNQNIFWFKYGLVFKGIQIEIWFKYPRLWILLNSSILIAFACLTQTQSICLTDLYLGPWIKYC